MRAASIAGTTLAWGVAIFLILLAGVVGSIGSVGAALCAILLLPFVWSRDGVAALRAAPAIQIFALVFVALAACFVLSARAPADVRYVGNFIALPLAIPVFLAARRATSDHIVLSVSILCLAGALVTLIVAGNDVFGRHLVRATGYYMGPNLIARLALLFGFLSLAGLFVTRWRWRFLLYLGPAAGLVVTYFSGTRGALIIAPPLALMVCLFLVIGRRERRHAAIFAVLTIVALAIMTFASDRMSGIGVIAEGVIQGDASSDMSTNMRLAMIHSAFELFPGSPIFGYGWASFSRTTYPILIKVFGMAQEDPNFQLHNDIANFMLAAGGIGLVCLVALFVAPIVGALRSPRDTLFSVRLYCCLQLSAWAAVSGLTDLTFGYDLPTTLYAFLTAIVLGSFRVVDGAPPARRAT